LRPNYESINIKRKKKVHVPAGYVTFSFPMGSSRPEEVAFFLENIIHVPLPRNLIIRNRKNEGRRFALTIDVPGGGGNARHGHVSFFTLLENKIPI
jgi:hypothetical protein